MNRIFLGIVVVAFVSMTFLGTAKESSQALFDGAKSAVELSIGLVGYIAFFLGLMKVLEEAGGLTFMARVIRPVLIRLFPDVPADHPAMGAMVMNMAANALGLGNAATPFGLKAMAELKKLAKEEGTATNAMVLFLAINTSGLAILPTGIIGLRALHQSADPASIFPTTLMATAISTTVAIIAAKLLSRLPMFRESIVDDGGEALARPPVSVREFLPLLVTAGALLSLVVLVYKVGERASAFIVPTLVLFVLVVGAVRKVKVYEVFIVGAKEGFQMAVTIIPYLVAILASVGMFRASGALDAIVSRLAPITSTFGLPGEVLPLAILRPLSGSGAFALTADLVERHHPDSYIGQLSSTINGSTETTFYVLAVYFGSVGVMRTRHAVPAGLMADVAGVVGSILAVKLLLST